MHSLDSKRPATDLDSPLAAHASPDMPIDAVYMWVDGADPGHQQSMAKYAKFSLWQWRGGDKRQARFRQNDELRYSLRSLECFAPWIRHVYLVTNGQVPPWLNTANNRITVVRHEEIFPTPGDLPTFNSLAIEVNLHRINGLSEYFLNFNDDVFLGRNITPADFIFGNGQQYAYCETWNTPSSWLKGTQTDRSIMHTAKLIEKHFGEAHTKLTIAHVPQMCSRSFIAELEKIWPEEFSRTSASRFRKSDNVFLWSLYFHSLMESKKHTCIARSGIEDNWQSTYAFAAMTSNNIRNAVELARIAKHRPKFFCLNDDFSETRSPESIKALGAIRNFLESYFPKKSSFERD